MSHLGDRIREVRTARGVLQADVAKAAGVSASAVSQWERGNSKSLRPEHLLAVARHFDVSMSWLITGKPPQRLVSAETESEALLLQRFRKLTESGQLAALSHVEWMADRERPPGDDQPPARPVIPKRVQ